jgi:hypothetical protein
VADVGVWEGVWEGGGRGGVEEKRPCMFELKSEAGWPYKKFYNVRALVHLSRSLALSLSLSHACIYIMYIYVSAEDIYCIYICEEGGHKADHRGLGRGLCSWPSSCQAGGHKADRRGLGRFGGRHCR